MPTDKRFFSIEWQKLEQCTDLNGVDHVDYLVHSGEAHHAASSEEYKQIAAAIASKRTELALARAVLIRDAFRWHVEFDALDECRTVEQCERLQMRVKSLNTAEYSPAALRLLGKIDGKIQSLRLISPDDHKRSGPAELNHRSSGGCRAVPSWRRWAEYASWEEVAIAYRRSSRHVRNLRKRLPRDYPCALDHIHIQDNKHIRLGPKALAAFTSEMGKPMTMDQVKRMRSAKGGK